ncbi:hypothetical protein ACHAXR_012130 [Thalassiosira sp. AJA248-18]
MVGSDFRAKLLYTPIIKRDLTGSSKKNKSTETKPFDSTLKPLREIHDYVRTHLSLDIWTINIILLTFIAGPVVWNSMKNSTDTQDEIPVDDPVEHSVRILMHSTRKLDSDESIENSIVNIISPEEDAKRILNELLASENIRNKASRIASGVIQSPPFQNAVYKLVKSIWDDLINDPETTSQLNTLVYTVLQNEKVYAAVKDLLLQLVNDEEVYRELTKLVVKLGEEREVIDATQQLLTESAHRTLNDPNVLDHSMEFATEVVGDDVVQRTGGEALRNTVGYAVQPSGGAVLMGIGTMIVAGCLHFYISRRGGGGGGESGFSVAGLSSPESRSDITIIRSNEQLLSAKSLDFSPTSGSGDCGHSTSNNDNPVVASLFLRVVDVAQKVAHFPSAVVGSIQSSVFSIIALPAYLSEKYSAGWEWIYDKLLHGVEYIFKIPSQLGLSVTTLASSAKLWASNRLYTMFYSCQSSIARTFQIFMGTVKGSHLVIVVAEYVRQMRDINEGDTWISCAARLGLVPSIPSSVGSSWRDMLGGVPCSTSKNEPPDNTADTRCSKLRIATSRSS